MNGDTPLKELKEGDYFIAGLKGSVDESEEEARLVSQSQLLVMILMDGISGIGCPTKVIAINEACKENCPEALGHTAIFAGKGVHLANEMDVINVFGPDVLDIIEKEKQDCVKSLLNDLKERMKMLKTVGGEEDE